jgi:glyoxylase-like metal-dependent hydrolase (beta-lactamase superfamily II)
MHEQGRLPVVIVAGLHADARTQVVNRLLRAVPGSIALHHDLATASEGTVRRRLRDASGVLSSGEAPLVNDCACCALREDLVPELERLAGHGLTRLAIVELWDSVEPKAMAEVIAAHSGDDLTLTNVITAVDPALVLPYLSNGDDLAEAGLALLAAPGHSPDHHVVWDAERETVFSGDLFLGVKVRVAHASEDARDLTRSLRVAAALRPRRLFDAHRGPIADPAGALLAKAAWIEETVGAIERRLAEGWSERAITREILGREPAEFYFSRGRLSKIGFVRGVRRTAHA